MPSITGSSATTSISIRKRSARSKAFLAAALSLASARALAEDSSPAAAAPSDPAASSAAAPAPATTPEPDASASAAARPEGWRFAAQLGFSAVIPFSLDSGFANSSDQLVEYASESPVPLTVGVEARQAGSPLGYFADFGYLSLSVNGRSFTFVGGQAGARYYPWNNGLYVFGSLGYRYASLNVPTPSLTADTVLATNAILSLTDFYARAGLGWELFVSRRVSFGIDVSFVQPLFPGGSLTLTDSTGQTDSADLQIFSGDFISTISGRSSFELTFPRFSWHFD